MSAQDDTLLHLRDHFATAALQAFIARGSIGKLMSEYGANNPSEVLPELARGCYEVADAMLDRRGKST